MNTSFQHYLISLRDLFEKKGSKTCENRFVVTAWSVRSLKTNFLPFSAIRYHHLFLKSLLPPNQLIR
jgi:hypothetical protein